MRKKILEKEESDNRLLELLLKIPGISINREKFIGKYFSPECKSISNENFKSVSIQKRDKIARKIIIFHCLTCSFLSFLAGIPEKYFLILSIPFDILQCYINILLVAQKLVFIYELPDNEINSSKLLLVSFFSQMVKTRNVNNKIKTISKTVIKQSLKKAPGFTVKTLGLRTFTKQIIKWFTVSTYKVTTTSLYFKIIPFTGGLISCILTLITFIPTCRKFKNHLKSNFQENM